jgi:predicted nucleic acid-binding protein
MKKVVVDTSVLIDFLRARDKANTLFTTLVASDYQLCISIITHTELYAGKSVWERQVARRDLNTLLSNLKLLPLTENISQKAGQLKAKHNIDLLDAIIAASAINNHIELATINTKHFRHIRGLKIYRPSAATQAT